MMTGSELHPATRPHICFERVRWADVDLVQIMRFSAFTRLVEHGEQEWLRAAGLPFRDMFDAPTMWLPRRQLTIDYLAPARLDDELAMVTYVSRVGDSSFTFHVDVADVAAARWCAQAAVVVVCVDRTTFTTRSLPKELRDAVAPWTLASADARAQALPWLAERAHAAPHGNS